MGLRAAIEVYREPRTRMVGLQPNPGDHSTDNGLLFTATYLHLLMERGESSAGEFCLFWELVRSCELEPGLIVRYPGDRGMQAHDDLIGIAAVNPILAREILRYGQRHGYSWNTEEPGRWTLRTFFYRMGGFVPFLKAQAKDSLSILDKINASAAYLCNFLEPRSETSGRCLLYLMSEALDERGGSGVRLAIELWRRRMASMYPGGIQELRSIYFGKDHPLALFSPQKF
jgi:hypothetical protein